MEDLGSLVARWPVGMVAVGVTDRARTVGLAGDPEWVTRIASVAKLLAGLAALVAIEEEAIELDEPAGPEGSTVRHLLAHASGLAFDERRAIAPPGRRRIYSNVGIEVFAEHLAERTGMPFEEYLRQGVLDPLGMRATELRGSPSHAMWSTVGDLLVFARELLRPTLVAPSTLADATRAPPRAGWGRPRSGAVRPLSLGPHVRDTGRQASSLDGRGQLARHLRPLRGLRDVPLGRSRGRAGRRGTHRSRVRCVGARGVAGLLRWRARPLLDLSVRSMRGPRSLVASPAPSRRRT